MFVRRPSGSVSRDPWWGRQVLWLRIVGGPGDLSQREPGPFGPLGGGLLIGRKHGRIVIAGDACGRTFEGDSDELIDV